MTAWGQTTTTGGNLTVTVSDPSGANVAGAVLEVRDPATNDTRHATTQENGIGRFLNLPGGTYSLSVSAKGFSNEVFESVLIQTSLETAVKATLKLGTTTESITVNASETPLVQTESSALSTNFDSKQIFNLPQLTRNTFSLVYDTPGYASGTFNNLPGGAVVAADFDGTQSMSNRFRDAGYAYGSSVVDPRIENIAELTVTTSQMDLGGNGTSAMRIRHRDLKREPTTSTACFFEDFRNTVLERQFVEQQRQRERVRSGYRPFDHQIQQLRRQHRRAYPQEQAFLLRHLLRTEEPEYLHLLVDHS